MIGDIFDDDLIEYVLNEDDFESFVQNASSLLNEASEKKDKELDSMLINLGKDETEKDIIRMICEDVDTEHQLATDLKHSKLDSSEWLGQQVERIVKEISPNASEDEIECIKTAIEQSLEKEIVVEAELFEKEMADNNK